MRNAKIINIAIIFMILGCWGRQELAYPSDISCLRVPMGIDRNRASAIKGYFEGRDDASPHRLTIDECRQQLLENMRGLRALYPLLQREFVSGLAILKSEGVDAFENKAYPRIKEASDKIKVKVSAIRTLPAVFGFSEPEMQERLDIFLQQIAKEARVDKVLIRFDIGGLFYNFTYTHGFNEQDLRMFHLNRGLISATIAKQEEPSDEQDRKKRERGRVLLKECE